MKIAKTVIFLQQNDDDANELDLIAEGKKFNKTPAESIQDEYGSEYSDFESFRMDTKGSQKSDKFNKKFKEQF